MKLSLNKKLIIFIILLSIVLGVFAIAIYARGIYDVTLEQYERYSIDITKLVAVKLDAERVKNVKNAIVEIYNHSEKKVMYDEWDTPEFEEYISQYAAIEQMEDYKAVRADLQKMQDELEVDCLYITWIDQENECYVYLVDAAHEDPCPPGCIDPLFTDNPSETVQNLSNGIPPTISRTPQYGWLLASDMPIFDSNNELIAMSCVDISMNSAMNDIVRFIVFIMLAFLAASIITCVLAFFLLNKAIVKPIKKLSIAALEYKNNKNAFFDLNIKRKDEIGVLSDSMVKMGEDIENYINDLTIVREQADQMSQMANTDALTGINNKRAYDEKVKQLNESRTPFGIAVIDINNLKVINDTYGHEKGDISIQIVSRFICQLFDRSSIYRFGGDEFIVVLEGAYYEKGAKLIRKLSELLRANESNTASPNWERVSAAVGYAVFNSKSDENVESVMHRADEKMYENKKSMKDNE